jgi:molybdopterin-guanine dinucleotide biosynthesis protein A
VLDALEGLRVRFLDEPELRAADPGLRSFVNVNTPGELETARARACAAAGGTP